MRTLLIFAFSILILTACEEALENPYEEFIISKGRHNSSINIEQLQSTTLRFSAIFDESAIYETENPINQYDINKLLGFSDCNSHHHTHSARFGWRWLDGSLDIHAYAYVNGERITERIGIVELNQAYNYELSFSDRAYYFSLQGYPTVTIPRVNTCNYGIYYMLFPYFGGDESAPHKVSIKIKINY